MAVLVGVFDAEEAAERAYVRLQEAGVPQSQIALISNVMGSSVQSRPTTAAELQAEQSADAISIRPAEGLEMATPHDGDPEGMRRVPAEHADVAPEVSDNPGLDAAALGAAIGALAGGGAAGPLGAVAGAAIGTGIGAFFAGRGVARDEAERYEDAVREGRYLVAVETDEPTPEMRAILDVTGADKVEVRAD
ncbi:MAG TPA: hypothetical protein VFN74_14070 [Chloroflexota bacterium]|nr:hypothetical protein [Chloroflexota bacterium]